MINQSSIGMMGCCYHYAAIFRSKGYEILLSIKLIILRIHDVRRKDSYEDDDDDDNWYHRER